MCVSRGSETLNEMEVKTFLVSVRSRRYSENESEQVDKYNIQLKF